MRSLSSFGRLGIFSWMGRPHLASFWLKFTGPSASSVTDGDVEANRGRTIKLQTESPMKTCQRCGAEKKSNRGARCMPCAQHVNKLRVLNRDKETNRAYSARGGRKAGRRPSALRQAKVTLAPLSWEVSRTEF